MATLSLMSVISGAMHRPELAGAPLYPHVDGAKSENRNPDWVNKSKTTFNAPTNIKALYLYADKAVVHYWQPPIVGGKRTQLSHSAVYRSQDKQFCFEPTTQLSEVSRLFGFLSTPYVLSNLEELWFDPVIFGASPMSNMLPKFNFAPGQVFGDSTSLLFAALGADAEKFPLLRAVVMFKGTTVVRSEHVDRINALESEKGALRRRVLAEDLTYLREFAAKTQSSYYVNANLKADVRKFEVRDYVFDDKYLKPFRTGLSAKYSGIATKPANAAISSLPRSLPQQSAVQIPSSKLEAMLNEYAASGYTQKQIAITLIAYAKEDASGLKAEYGLFSAEGKRKFGALIDKAVS